MSKVASTRYKGGHNELVSPLQITVRTGRVIEWSRDVNVAKKLENDQLHDPLVEQRRRTISH